MKIPKSNIYYFILSLFFLYGLNNYIFERKFFFNEILSLIGILFFLVKLFPNIRQGKMFLPHSLILKLILLLLLLGFFHLTVSLFTKTNTYFYLRNSVIVYSIFTFFIGFFSLPYLMKYVRKVRVLLFFYLSYALTFPSIGLLERFMGAVFFPFLFKKLNIVSLTGIIFLDIVLAWRYGSLTVILVTGLLMIILILPNYFSFKMFSSSILVGLLLAFIYFIPNLQLYKTPPYSLFGNIEAVAFSNYFLNLDGNSTWRAVFWYRLLVERFPENIIGIGFGTPLLDYVKGLDTVPMDHDDEHDIHVSGSHNTYLTLALRMGLPFIIILFFIFRKIFREFYIYRKYYFSKAYNLIFVSFFSVSIIGLFNLVLESPTGASLFWILLGFVAACIYERQKASFNG